MLKRNKKIKNLFIIIFLFFSTLAILVLNVNTNLILNDIDKKGELYSDRFSVYTNQPDLVGPNITFIQPSYNNTDIKSKSYKIIVNITDDNPPLPGFVLIQISNLTELLINTSMTSEGGDTWIYNWENLNTYKNKIYYILRVWAKDSSPNETSSLSEAWYVYLNISSRISILIVIINIIGTSVVFAGIIVFFSWYANRKLPRRPKD